ncbi:hypothetical protein BWI96_06110 [Siphonobacter sp. SORGH_AS_0500]|nr:hypothetical protein BWI96_06110 [Siphonobacter sp. SORGH_AS_0500]
MSENGVIDYVRPLLRSFIERFLAHFANLKHGEVGFGQLASGTQQYVFSGKMNCGVTVPAARVGFYTISQMYFQDLPSSDERAMVNGVRMPFCQAFR